jgi:hypothetical protein
VIRGDPRNGSGEDWRRARRPLRPLEERRLEGCQPDPLWPRRSQRRLNSDLQASKQQGILRALGIRLCMQITSRIDVTRPIGGLFDVLCRSDSLFVDGEAGEEQDDGEEQRGEPRGHGARVYGPTANSSTKRVAEADARSVDHFVGWP